MTSRDGKNTGRFGLWLSQYLKADSQISVFYDHGNRQKDSNIVAIKGFYGEHVSNKNRLADIDVMVVNHETNKVLLLIEIEESKMEPKKLLGDILTVLMCNRYAVKIENEQKYFNVSPTTRLIVAGIVSSKGAGHDKIKQTIIPRLKQFNLPNNSIQMDKIELVYEDNISQMIIKLKCKMRNFFPIHHASKQT